jgi:hypothetical protein
MSHIDIEKKKVFCDNCEQLQAENDLYYKFIMDMALLADWGKFKSEEKDNER